MVMVVYMDHPGDMRVNFGKVLSWPGVCVGKEEVIAMFCGLVGM